MLDGVLYFLSFLNQFSNSLVFDPSNELCLYALIQLVVWVTDFALPLLLLMRKGFDMFLIVHNRTFSFYILLLLMKEVFILVELMLFLFIFPVLFI